MGDEDEYRSQDYSDWWVWLIPVFIVIVVIIFFIKICLVFPGLFSDLFCSCGDDVEDADYADPSGDNRPGRSVKIVVDRCADEDEDLYDGDVPEKEDTDDDDDDDS